MICTRQIEGSTGTTKLPGERNSPGSWGLLPVPDYALGDGDGEAESESDGEGEALALFFAVEDFFFMLVDGEPLDEAFAVIEVFLVVEADVEVVVVVACLLAQAAISATAAITAIVEMMDFFIVGSEAG